MIAKRKNGHPALYYLGLLAALMLFNACNVTKHLDESKGERLLIKNSIDIKAEPRLGFSEKAALQYELGSQYKQQPNRRSWPTQLFQRRVWLYHKYKNRTDKSKFARWIIKRIAEPPAIFDEELTIRTAKNFQNQMQQRGYFNAHCKYKVQFTGKYKVKVKYTLNLGRQYTVDGLEFKSRDTFVQQVMRETAGASLLKPGVSVSAPAFDAEKARITAELRNRGLAFFTPNFIEFSGDTSKTRTCVTVEVLTPNDTSQHRQYFLDDITVFEGLIPDYSTLRSEDTLGGITYFTDKPAFQVKPYRLKESLFIRPGQRYNQSDFDKTARNLNALGVFRFVAIRPVQDSLQREKLDVGIFLTPNKRYAFGWDADLNSTSSSNALTRNLLGLSTSVSFRNRNMMGGAENLQTDLQYNVEFNIATRDRFIFSQEIKYQNQLSVPRFFDYFRFWKTSGKLHVGRRRLLPAGLYQRLKEDAQSRITLNFNYLELFDFYKFNLINASYGFDLRSNEHQHSFNHIGIDILRPSFSENFTPTTFLRRSFDNQLFTGFILRSFSYAYASKQNRFGERWQLRFNSDLSGFEEHVLNRLWSAAFGDQNWVVSDLEFAKYLRLDFDATYSREFRKDLIGAFRISSGIAKTFGDTRSVPYVKQFFVGGPSSIRAWRIREIGPGGYYDPAAQFPFYEAADFRFEFNGELRFPMFWWLKGAVFVDGGNIWTLQPEVERPDSELDFDAYKNIALGSGFGVRGDFSYFILRLDWGLPLRNPYPDNADTDSGYWVKNRFSKLQFKDFRPNIAVGYPF